MGRVIAVQLGMALLACVGSASAQLDVLSDVNEFPLVTGRAYAPQISGSGRFVLYRYWRGSTEGLTEQYVLIDLLTRTSTLVSVNDAGEPMNTGGLSTPRVTSSASVSEDGRWVVFDSRSTNLVAGETAFETRTYLRDTVLRTTRLLFDAGADVLSLPRGDRSLERIFVMRYIPGSSPLWIDFVLFERSSGETRNLFSVQFDDLIAPGFPRQPELSADGRYLVFATRTNGLVPQDQNDEHDVFRLDVDSGVIVRVSEDVNGLDSGGVSYSADISDDGRYVVFLSKGSNWLAAGSQIPFPNHAWRKDLQTGVLEPINTRWRSEVRMSRTACWKMERGTSIGGRCFCPMQKWWM